MILVRLRVTDKKIILIVYIFGNKLFGNKIVMYENRLQFPELWSPSELNSMPFSPQEKKILKCLSWEE